MVVGFEYGMCEGEGVALRVLRLCPARCDLVCDLMWRSWGPLCPGRV